MKDSDRGTPPAPPTWRTTELERALYDAHDAFARLTPDQQVHHRHQQRTSFAYGNLAISRVRPTGREYAVDPAIRRLDEERLMRLVREAAGPCPCDRCTTAAAAQVIAHERSDHDGDGPCAACEPPPAPAPAAACQVSCVLACRCPQNWEFLRQATGITLDRMRSALRDGSVHVARACVVALLDKMIGTSGDGPPTFHQVKCTLEHVSKILSRAPRGDQEE